MSIPLLLTAAIWAVPGIYLILAWDESPATRENFAYHGILISTIGTGVIWSIYGIVNLFNS